MILAKLYRAFRYAYPLIAASHALKVAREAAAMGLNYATRKTARFDLPGAVERCVYWSPTEYSPRGHSIPELCGMYNPRAEPDGPRDSRHCRFVDGLDLRRSGLRLVGFADEIAKREYSRSIEHTGWYTDPFGDSDGLMRGVVYQLPARNGRPVFVYGYADPHNDGSAFLCFDNDADSPLEAAKFADSFAERAAEREREYQTNEMAKERAAEYRADVKAMREALRAIRSELSACRKRCKNWRKSKRYAALLGAVRNEIERLREDIAEKLRRASQLDAEPWSIIESRY